MDKKKNVLITGGCGFIGSNLIRYLKTQSGVIENISVVDNLSKGRISYLPHYVNFFNADILDFNSALKMTKDIDVVIHLAAESGVPISIENPMKSVSVNIIGTQNYLEASRINKVKKFIFASSGGTILGNQDPPCHEESKIKPISPYGAGKAAGEHLCNSYHESFGLNTTIFRFANVYGPYSLHKKGNFVPEFIKSFVKEKTFKIFGDTSRDFVYIDDLIRGLFRGIICPESTGQTFQLATDTELSITKATDIMNKIMKRRFGKTVKVEHHKIRSGDVLRNYAMIDKIRVYLN